MSNASNESGVVSPAFNEWVLELNDVEKRVPLDGGQALEILKGVSLRLRRGSSLAIVGRSGSGKTTLLGLLAGLDVASSGVVKLLGHDLAELDEDARADLRAAHVGFVFQSFQLLPTLSARDNVALPLELKGVADAAEKAETILGELGLSGRIGHFPAQMSGGEQQRVALARAFACSPDILFADEPTGNLDSQTGGEIINALFERNLSKGASLVLVTHDMALANKCELVVHIEDGRVLKVESGGELVDQFTDKGALNNLDAGDSA